MHVRGDTQSEWPDRYVTLLEEVVRNGDAIKGDLVDESVAFEVLHYYWRVFLDGSLDSNWFSERVNEAISRGMIRLLRPRIKMDVSDKDFETALLSVFPESDDRTMDISMLRNATDFVASLDKVIGTASADPRSDVFKKAWLRLKPRVTRLTPNLIASVKDIYAEYLLWLKKHPDSLDRLAWEAFETLIAEILASRGFDVDLTGRVRNRSADIVAIRTDELGVDTRYLIECKRYSRDRRVGLGIVNAVVGASRRANVDHALLVTSSSFTEDVERERNRLRECRLHLRDGDDIVNWLQEYRPREDSGLWLPARWNEGI